jgi:catechol 2,3-dioxygenase-like lactoylglutathione lyase family enzyme
VFDHVTLRVPDLSAATTSFAMLLDELEIQQTPSTPSFSVWGNFALTQADDDHPAARRVHVAFIAPTQNRVERFAQAGIDAGFADDALADPHPDHGDDHDAAFLKDGDGNIFEAVHRDGERPLGNIDHLAIRVNDLDASAMFYRTIADSAGLALRRQTVDLVEFSVDEGEGSLIVIAGEPTENVHVAFSGDEEEVRGFHAGATAAGYRSNGEPGERPRYHAGYYSAYVLDPDGNNIEVVNHHHHQTAAQP